MLSTAGYRSGAAVVGALRRGRPLLGRTTLQHQGGLRYLSTTDKATTDRTCDEDKNEMPTSTENNNYGTVSSDQPSPAALSPTTSDYVTATLELSKARLSALVVVTTGAGFLAAGNPLSYTTFAAATAGTALCSSSASTLNQIFEMDRDKRMKRTRNRPLVRGIVTPQTATALAATTGISGGSILALGTDPVTAALGVGNIALYAGLYTYLKPRSEINTWVGAVVGAVPPVMGWTAATGGSLFDLEATLLGSTLFLWQFPHFFALSWMHRTDYARGGFQMVPVNDINTNGDRTAALINRYTWYMSTIPIASSVLGATSSMFAVEGIVLNAYALYVAKRFDKERSNSNARKVFLTSLWYLPCLMTLFILHSRRWKNPVEEDDKLEDNDVVAILRRRLSQIRKTGRELCPHEILALADGGENKKSSNAAKKNEEKCPIVVGKAKVNEATEVGTATVVAAATAASAVTASEGMQRGAK